MPKNADKEENKNSTQYSQIKNDSLDNLKHNAGPYIAPVEKNLKETFEVNKQQTPTIAEQPKVKAKTYNVVTRLEISPKLGENKKQQPNQVCIFSKSTRRTGDQAGTVKSQWYWIPVNKGGTGTGTENTGSSSGGPSNSNPDNENTTTGLKIGQKSVPLDNYAIKSVYANEIKKNRDIKSNHNKWPMTEREIEELIKEYTRRSRTHTTSPHDQPHTFTPVPHNHNQRPSVSSSDSVLISKGEIMISLSGSLTKAAEFLLSNSSLTSVHRLSSSSSSSSSDSDDGSSVHNASSPVDTTNYDFARMCAKKYERKLRTLNDQLFFENRHPSSTSVDPRKSLVRFSHDPFGEPFLRPPSPAKRTVGKIGKLKSMFCCLCKSKKTPEESSRRGSILKNFVSDTS